MTTTGQIPAAEALSLADLITPVEGGIASRILAKTGGGSITLFAFARGEGLSEHTSPFEAFVLVLEGTIAIAIGGQAVSAGAGAIVRLPAAVPHALDAGTAARMLLVMLKEPKS